MMPDCAYGAATQAPAVQLSPAAHMVPHIPQFAASIRVFTQAPSQRVLFPWHPQVESRQT
jgi:hypothetical protein